MLDECNPFVNSFKMARDMSSSNTSTKISIKLIQKRNSDGKTYNLPTYAEVSTLKVGDISPDNV